MAAHQSVRAAQYVRMSTEHQNYSIEGQLAANAAYALEHGYEIVRTYTDAGVSGLDLKRRGGLKRLLADVVGGRADFLVILVYDVSRWGRFQDPDESAHYEFLCRAAGVRIEYAAEPFNSDGSLASGLVKHLKRAMAAEYSRELSAKIVRAQRGLALKGYWQGGPAGYGFRRRMVAPDGTLGPVLSPHEQKGLQDRRTIIVPGPDEEVATVRRIFRRFATDGRSTQAIALELNADGLRTATGALWSRAAVLRLLRDQKCIGVLVVGRRATRLKRSAAQPRSAWVRVEDACVPIVDRRLWRNAQAAIRTRKPSVSDGELLEELRGVLARRGRLSDDIIRQDGRAHAPAVYVRRFGGLTAAYALIGYHPTVKQMKAAARVRVHRPQLYRYRPVQPSDQALIDGARRLLHEQGRLSSWLIDTVPYIPSSSYYRRRFGSLRRLYELVGYGPTPRQHRALAAHDAKAQNAPATFWGWAASAGKEVQARGAED